MTEQPQDPTQLLLQLIDEIKQLKQENAALKKIVTEDIPKAVDNQIAEVAAAVEAGFKNRDEIINQLRSTPLAAPAPTSTASKLFDQIGGLIEKYTSGTSGAAAVNPEVTAPQMELVKTLDKIQLMYAKKFLMDTAKAFGVPSAIETAEHVVVT